MAKPWLSAVTLAAMILTGPVFAHARLRSTIPAADARLQVAPKSLTLSFNESVRLAVLTLTTGGKDIPLTVDRNAPAAAQVSIALPLLAVGQYVVQWSALSVDDGHVSKGTFTFAVVTAAALASPAAQQ
jgi:hypothetical protein